MERNQLTHLPRSIGNLLQLQTLNVKGGDTKPCRAILRQLQSQATECEGNAAGQTDLPLDPSVSMATRGNISVKSSMTLRIRDLWGRRQANVVTGKLSDGNRV